MEITDQIKILVDKCGSERTAIIYLLAVINHSDQKETFNEELADFQIERIGF